MPKEGYYKLNFDENVLLVTPFFWNTIKSNFKLINKILYGKEKERSKLEGFEVYYSHIETGLKIRPTLDFYIKHVHFLEGKPIKKDKYFGNKSPEREFFNYLRLKHIRNTLSKNQRKKINFAEPLLCYHDYNNQMSYIVTEAVNNTITLDKLLKLKNLKIETRFNAIKTVDESLKLLHSKGILYQDTNIENFLISRTEINSCYFIDPEYAFFKEDEELQKRVFSSGKGFDQMIDEELKRFRKYSGYEAISLEYQLQNIKNKLK